LTNHTETPRLVRTVADLIGNAAHEFVDREAFRSFGVSLTCRDPLAHADAATSWLQRAGLTPSDRMALMMPNLLPTLTALRCLTRIEFEDELPKSVVGKLLRPRRVSAGPSECGRPPNVIARSECRTLDIRQRRPCGTARFRG
jgi:hypothetical protein